MFNDEKYLAIEKKISKLQEEYANKKNSGVYTKSYLSVLKEEMENELKNDLQAYYDGLQANAEDKVEELKKIEAKKLADAKIDPSEEIIRRQDLQMKLDFADDHELVEMVDNYIETGEGNKTELDFLRAELRKRELKDLKDASYDEKLKSHMKQNNISEPWKNAPEYQASQEQIALLSQVRNTGFLHIKEEDTNRMIEVTVEQLKVGYTRPGEYEYKNRVAALDNA